VYFPYFTIMPAQSKAQRTAGSDPEPPKKYKHVRKYKAEEIDIDLLVRRAHGILRAKPFKYQLEIAAAVLQGEDVIIDVGTGCRKTLCFTLPLLLSAEDISMIVSPLSALMIDQAIFFSVFNGINSHSSLGCLSQNPHSCCVQ
jgi:superfamily II DNA helicase RecQ